MNSKKTSLNIDELRKGARAGSRDNQYELSKILLANSSGKTSSNYIEAIKLLELAAKDGLVDAQVALADEQSESEDTYDSAVAWFKRAASEKNPYAIRRLGELLYYNSRSEKELMEGLKYLRVSARIGDRDSAYQLGVIYLNPKSDLIMIDEDEAIHYLKMSSNAGKVEAIIALGFIYATGVDGGNTEKDFKLSKDYFELAISKNSIESYHDLAVLHFKEAFRLLDEGVSAETKHNSVSFNDKIKHSTNLRKMLKSFGVEY